MNYKRLQLFFWGYFLIILDFTVRGFDILPDVLGYGLLLAGFLYFSKLSADFKLEIIPTTVSIALCLIDFYQVVAAHVSGMNPVAFPLWFSAAYSAFGLLVDLAIISLMFRGFYKMAADVGHQDFATDLYHMGWAVILLQLVILVNFIGILIGWVLCVLFSYILSLIFMLILLTYLNRIGKLLPLMHDRFEESKRWTGQPHGHACWALRRLCDSDFP